MNGGMTMFRNDISERRPCLFALFIWCYSAVWLIAGVYTWRNCDRWPLWAKIGAVLGLIIATPAGSDLFLFMRVRRIMK